MADNQKNGDMLERVRFVYQKARHHRTFHADGVWAGITPQLEIQFAFFNDLKPMPDEVIHRLKDDGSLGEEVSRDMQQSVTREVNVTVVMNKEAVKQML